MSDVDSGRAGGSFPVTRWSLVLRAAGTGTEASRALELLCEQYWPPLYRFLRRSGAQREDAEDYLQGFLFDFIRRNDFRRADRDKGRFRSYLLGALKHYISNVKKKLKKEAAGGKVVHVPFVIDTEGEEVRYAKEPPCFSDPNRIFHRDWAQTLLDHSLERVEKSFASRGQLERYKVYLGLARGDVEDRTYKEAADGLGVSVSLVKKGVGQLRRELDREVRRAILDTIDDPALLNEELDFLMSALGEQPGGV